MRAQEFIVESLNQPYPLQWEHGEFGDYDAYTQLRDGTTLCVMFNKEGDNAYTIEFYRNNRQEVTGEGDSQRIFATVISAIQEFLKKEQPMYISYTAQKTDDEDSDRTSGRVSLYSKLFRRYANAWGYQIKNAQDSGDYIKIDLKRTNQNVNVELDEDWRNWVAGVGTAAMLAGGGGAAYDAYQAKQQAQQPQATQQVQKAPQVDPHKIQQAQALLTSAPAKMLYKVAMSSGIQGTELAQFMAQCAHETADFSTLKEYGGKLDFKKYDIKYNPAKAKALGNIHPGDGARYFGRGFIQLTGRYNYKRAGEALGLPLEKHPEMVEKPDVAAKVAVWFWQNRVQPNVDNFQNTKQATKPINPGMKGLQNRHDKFVAMNQVLAKN